MTRQLFQPAKAIPISKTSRTDLEKLVEIQAKILADEYSATCFDVKQLQKILSVGESNVYGLLRSGALTCRTIGRRKVVSAVALARFLVIGDEKSS